MKYDIRCILFALNFVLFALRPTQGNQWRGVFFFGEVVQQVRDETGEHFRRFYPNVSRAIRVLSDHLTERARPCRHVRDESPGFVTLSRFPNPGRFIPLARRSRGVFRKLPESACRR